MRCDVGGNCAAPFSICTAAGRAEACEQQHSGRVGYFNKSAAAYLGQSQSGAEECPALEAWRAKQLAPLRIPFLLPPTRRAAPRMSDTAAAICERSGEPLVSCDTCLLTAAGGAARRPLSEIRGTMVLHPGGY